MLVRFEFSKISLLRSIYIRGLPLIAPGYYFQVDTCICTVLLNSLDEESVMFQKLILQNNQNSYSQTYFLSLNVFLRYYKYS